VFSQAWSGLVGLYVLNVSVQWARKVSACRLPLRRAALRIRRMCVWCNNNRDFTTETPGIVVHYKTSQTAVQQYKAAAETATSSGG